MGVPLTLATVASRWVGMEAVPVRGKLLSVYAGMVDYLDLSAGLAHVRAEAARDYPDRVDRWPHAMFSRIDAPYLNWTAARSAWNEYEWLIDTPLLRVNRLSRSIHPNSSWHVAAPLWPLAVGTLGGGVSLVWAGQRVRRRARLLLCSACGYDLTGLAGGAVCPECGKAG